MTTIINGSSPSITFSDGSAQTSATQPFQNRIINGAMVIDQRNAGASVTPTNGQYLVDRFSAILSAASKFSVQQDAGAVTPPVGFNDYLGCTSLSAYSVGAAESFGVAQSIEGYNVADLDWGTANAKTVTLSFWVRSSLTGTFGGAIRNSAADRSYPYSYTISTANTWEYKTVTIAGDTSGTWLKTNGIGLQLIFGLGSGATRSGTAGAWAGTSYTNATGATSVVGVSGATLFLTGVQLEVGSTATSFDYRPYGTELALCQRYYYKQKSTGSVSFFGLGYGSSTTLLVGLVPFPSEMRTAPTALEQSGTATDYRVSSAGTAIVCSAVPTFNSADVWGSTTVFTVASGLTSGGGGVMRSANATAYLAWSAEL
jgi:hypothetical protein